MAGKFILNAQIKLVAPNNSANVLSQIRSQLQGVNVPVKINTQGVSRQITQITSNIRDLGGASTRTLSDIEKLGAEAARSLRRFSIFTIATAGVYKFSQALSYGVNDALSFNKEMVKLQQVTGESQKRLRGISDEITRLSIQFGYSSTKILDVAVTLSQAGLSANDTKIALEALTKTGVAATFGSLRETTEESIAIMNQFNIKSKDLGTTLGSVNRVAAEFAVEAEDIGIAVRRAGSTFAAAGGNFHEFQALFTSIRQTTRASAESIATGLRTIEARLQRPRTQSFLRSLGIELLDAKGQFVGLYGAVERLHHGLSGLQRTDPRFAQIAEELGGYRQLDKIIPLIEQFGVAQKVLNSSIRGSNSLTHDASIYQESLAGKISSVNEQFQALIRNFTNDTVFKKMIDGTLALATAFIKLADAARPFAAIFTALGVSRAIPQLTSFRRGFNSNIFSPGAARFASGGSVTGPGSTDTVPAMLSPGEFVMNRNAVKKIGVQNLSALNNGSVRAFAKGGPAGPLGGFLQKPEHFSLDTKAVKQALKEIERLGVDVKSFISKIKIQKEVLTSKGEQAYGTYTTATKVIKLSQSQIKSSERLLSTLAHEIGHGVDRSSFSINGNVGFSTDVKGHEFRQIGLDYVSRNQNHLLDKPEGYKKYWSEPIEGFANQFSEDVVNAVKKKKLHNFLDNREALQVRYLNRIQEDSLDRKSFFIEEDGKKHYPLGNGGGKKPPKPPKPPAPPPPPGPPNGPLYGPFLPIGPIQKSINRHNRRHPNSPVRGGYDYGPNGPFGPDIPPTPKGPNPVNPFDNNKPYIGKRSSGTGFQFNPLMFGAIVIGLSELAGQFKDSTGELKKWTDRISNSTAKLIALGSAAYALYSVVGTIGKQLKNSGGGNPINNYLDNNQSGLARKAKLTELKRQRNLKAQFLRNNSEEYIDNNAKTVQFIRDESGRTTSIVTDVGSPVTKRRTKLTPEQFRSVNKANRLAANKAARRVQYGQGAVIVLGGGALIAGGFLSEYGNKNIENGSDTTGAASIGGGTLQGAGAGAALGAVFGPWGIAIGAAVGGLAGFTTSLIETQDKIKSIKLDKDLANLSYKINSVNLGKLGYQSNKGLIVNSLIDSRKEYNTSNAEHQQQIKVGITQNSSAIQEFFDKIARESKTFDEFEKATKGSLYFFSKTANLPYTDLENSIKKTIESSKIQKVNTDKVNAALEMQSKRLLNFNALITGLNEVDAKLSGFSNSLDRTSSFLEFSVSSYKTNDTSAPFQQALEGNVGETFFKYNSALGSGLGSAGLEISKNAEEQARVIKDLPEALLKTRAEDPLGSRENFVERLLSKFSDKGPNGNGISEGTKTLLVNAITAIIHRGEDKEQVILDKIKFNVKELSDELAKEIGISIEEMAKLEPKIKEHVNRISSSFSLYNKAQEKLTDLSIKELHKQFEVSDYQNDVYGNGRPIELNQLQAREFLTAIRYSTTQNTPGSANVDVLAERLKNAQDKIVAFDNVLKDKDAQLNSNDSKLFLEGRSEAELEANNAAKALHYLAFESKNLSNIQKHIAEEQKKAKYHQSIGETLIFGSKEEKKRLAETISFSAVAEKFGIQNVPESRRRDVQEHLKNNNPELYDRLFGSALGNKGIGEKRVDELVTATNENIDRLMSQFTDAAAEQQRAADAIANNISTQADAIKTSITDANNLFLTELQKHLENAISGKLLGDIETHETGIKENQDKLNSALGLRDKFSKVKGGDLTEDDLENTRGRVSALQEYYNAKRNRAAIDRETKVAVEDYTRGKKYIYGPELNRIEKAGKEKADKFDIDAEEAKKRFIEAGGDISLLSQNISKLSIALTEANKILETVGDTTTEGIRNKNAEHQKNIDIANELLQNIDIANELLPKHAKGGIIGGVGTGTSDSNLALLSRGEFVINEKSAKEIGYDKLNMMNSGMIPRFARGGRYNPKKMSYEQQKALFDETGKVFGGKYSYAHRIARYYGYADKYNYEDSVKKLVFDKKRSLRRDAGKFVAPHPLVDYNGNLTNLGKYKQGLKIDAYYESLEKIRLAKLDIENRQAFQKFRREKFLEKKQKKAELKAKKIANNNSIPLVQGNNPSNTAKTFSKNKQNVVNKNNGITPNIGGITAEQMKSFTNAVTTFSKDLKNITEKLGTSKIEVGFNGKFEVVLNGAEVLTKIESKVREMAIEEVIKEIQKYDAQVKGSPDGHYNPPARSSGNN